jgi:dTDP-glucose pyrophosphorylase
VIVNYCDFTCFWNYKDFCRFVEETASDGCLPAYRGFHPHSLGSTYYAYIRDENGVALDIQEKKPFTDTPMNEYASSGTYYFRTAELFATYAAKTIDQKLTVNNEYYVSMVYKPMFADGKHVTVYELQHFMQWGTPADLAEYVRWSDAFRYLANDKGTPAAHDGLILMPMAGAGKRFADAGFTLPKPLIPVSGKPMVIQAVDDLPKAPRTRFIVRKDLPFLDQIMADITKALPSAEFTNLEKLTEGQAITALMGLDGIAADAPVTIGACDNGLLYNPDDLFRLMQDKNVDVICWGVRGHPAAAQRPQMFGWLDADDKGMVKNVSVKVPLANPKVDPIVTGCFTFKRVGDFRRAVDRMVARGARVNNEFYIDMAINDAIALGLRVALFEVDFYLGWGTPNELATFNYWQSCFHKWASHPYRLEKDRRVPESARAELEKLYAETLSPRPGQRKAA